MEDQEKIITSLISNVLEALVDNPTSIRLTRQLDEMGVLYLIDVHPDDMGKIIGKGGDTAKAMRSIVRAAGMRLKQRVHLKINEPEGSRVREQAPQHTAGVPLEDLDAAISNL